jgi:hypothetical protein
MKEAALSRPINVEAKLAVFDSLPDDAIVDEPVAAELLGVSLDTYRRNPPVPRRRFSKRRVGARVGDLRALSRGEAA